MLLEIQALEKQTTDNHTKAQTAAVSFLSADQKTKLKALEDSSKLREEIGEAARLNLLAAPAAPPAGTGAAAAQSPRHQSLLTQTLSATARGTCPDIMGTELRVQCQSQMPMMGQVLAQKGSITGATFVGIQDTPTGPAETYRVNFAQGAMIWLIATSPDGKIQILWSPG